jgi:hypothetical protein
MTRTTLLVPALTIALGTLLQAAPAHAQRVFVSGSGSDSNPCSFAQPCRTFQQAFNTVAANGEIDVLEPAGYGAINITHGISIQAHGFSGITQTANPGNAITINAGTSDDITLNGLLLDGSGVGENGISITQAGSVQILNCVMRNFNSYGIIFEPTSSPTNLLVSNTVASDNAQIGIYLDPQSGGSSSTMTLSNVTANHNGYGALVSGGTAMIASSVFSNNATYGLDVFSGTAWLAKSVVSGNGTGVNVALTGTVNSYGDNDINGNTTTDVSGTLTPATKQ